MRIVTGDDAGLSGTAMCSAQYRCVAAVCCRPPRPVLLVGSVTWRWSLSGAQAKIALLVDEGGVSHRADSHHHT